LDEEGRLEKHPCLNYPANDQQQRFGGRGHPTQPSIAFTSVRASNRFFSRRLLIGQMPSVNYRRESVSISAENHTPGLFVVTAIDGVHYLAYPIPSTLRSLSLYAILGLPGGNWWAAAVRPSVTFCAAAACASAVDANSRIPFTPTLRISA
jgi:hypothetical protein